MRPTHLSLRAPLLGVLLVLAGCAVPGPAAPRAEDVRFTGAGGVSLAGTVTSPATTGSHPAVVLVNGTGKQDRNCAVGGHRPFAVLADALTAAGVVVLRTDDRGVGGSDGDLNTAGYDALVDDVLAGTDLLADRPDVDPARIGVLGHSEGGYLAPLAADRAGPGRVAFTVLLAAPGVPGGDVSIEQAAMLERAAGASEAEIARTVEATATVVGLLRAGDLAGAAPIVRAEAARIGVPPDEAEASLPALRAFVVHDPDRALRALRVPVLALYGGRDLLVSAEQNRGPLEAALTDAPDVTVETFEGLNHLLQPAVTGLPDEYAASPVAIDPAVLDRVATWVAARGRPA